MFYSEGELTVESPGGLEQEKSRCKVVTGSSYGKMERQEVCVAAGAVRRPSGGRQETATITRISNCALSQSLFFTFSVPSSRSSHSLSLSPALSNIAVYLRSIPVPVSFRFSAICSLVFFQLFVSPVLCLFSLLKVCSVSDFSFSAFHSLFRLVPFYACVPFRCAYLLTYLLACLLACLLTYCAQFVFCCCFHFLAI